MTMSKKFVAYHEAGHAVTAIALRLPFEYVTIVPDENRHGHVQFRKVRPTITRGQAVVEAMAFMGGQVATAALLHKSERPEEDFTTGERIDLGFAVMTLESFWSGPERLKRVMRTTNKTVKLFNNSKIRKMTEVLAEALLVKQTMSFSEAVTLLYDQGEEASQ